MPYVDQPIAAAGALEFRGPDTALRDALPRHLGLLTMAEPIAAVHLGTVSAQRGLELTPVLFDVVESGDRIAAHVVRRQGAEAAPHALPRVVSAPPVLGAALLGLDRLGVTTGVAGRVRAAFG